MNEIQLRFGWMLVTLLIFLIAAEIGCRLILADTLRLGLDERTLAYQFDDSLGWLPRKNIRMPFRATRDIFIEHNSAGLRDDEFLPDQRRRLLLIGDSNVWGFDVEAHERFSDLLQERRPEWQIINAGISGFGTDQIYLLLKKLLPRYQPEVVFMAVNKNDRTDNMTNYRYGSYYKPYFELQQDQLVLKGVPVPKSLRYHAARSPILLSSYLVRAILLSYNNIVHPTVQVEDPTEALINEIKRLSEANGATLLLGFGSSAPQLAGHCRQTGISYAELQNPHYYPDFGSHWTPTGHLFVADQIDKLMTAAGYFAN